jgi:DNA-binding MarR family transcriptional regulator
LLETFDRNPGFAHMCLIESLRGDRRVSERRARAQEALASALDEGRRQSMAAADLPPLTAQGVVGGVCAVLHARLMERETPTFVELIGPLTAMIVHPYLGAVASRRELERPPAAVSREMKSGVRDPFKDLPIRFTYRTARVLSTIAENPGASNRTIADSSGIVDEGQMSRLLRRLQSCELIENLGRGQQRGEPNAWVLTERGEAIRQALTEQSTVPS